MSFIPFFKYFKELYQAMDVLKWSFYGTLSDHRSTT